MTDDLPPWRPEFIAALRLLAQASDAMAERGLSRPILVGGGAVEFYTGSMLMTGDIDVTSAVQPEFEEELQRLGFRRPSGAGKSLRGWVHPDLGLGFEVVASVPLDGGVETTRIRLIRPIGETAAFRILPVEDMIADRMGQFASGTAPEMRAQAQTLLALYPDLDRAYLERRIREETLGDHGIEDVPG